MSSPIRVRPRPTDSVRQRVREIGIRLALGAPSAGVLRMIVIEGMKPTLVGLAIGVATIVGDLVESLLKRQTGVKDSGVLIPGHGGLLDRMDSLLLCAPVAFVYLRTFAA